MSIPAISYLFFSLALIIALLMIAEGGSILFLKKRFTPLPSRLLAGISRFAAGRKAANPRFSGSISTKDLCTYASCDLMFGTLILISSSVYLFTVA